MILQTYKHKKIGWGILGCGNVTEVKIGLPINKVPKSSNEAFMRRSLVKAADYAKKHQIAKWLHNTIMIEFGKVRE